MIYQISDKNVSALKFDSLSNCVLHFEHKNEVQFEYTSSASLKYVEEGRIKYTIDGQTVILNPKNYLFIEKGCRVTTTLVEPTKGSTVFFDNTSGAHDCISGLSSFPIFDSTLIDSFCSTIIESKSLGLDRLESLRLELKNYLNQIGSHLNDLDLKTFSARVEMVKKLWLAKYLIEKKSTKNLSIESLAMETMLSKYELIRQFKKIFGLTPYQYFLKCKVEHAKHDLIEGKTLNEIAVQYSISDAFAFSKMFKRVTGFTPSTFKSIS